MIGRISERDFELSLAFLSKKARRRSDVENFIHYYITSDLKRRVGPAMDVQVARCLATHSEFVMFDTITKALAYLAKEVEKYQELLTKHGGNAGTVTGLLKAVLYHVVEGNILVLIRKVYQKAFETHYHLKLVVPYAAGSGEKCICCKRKLHRCVCETIMQKFHAINKQLIELDLIERLAGEQVCDILRSKVQGKIAVLPWGQFEVSHVDMLKEWLSVGVFDWLRSVYAPALSQDVEPLEMDCTGNKAGCSLIDGSAEDDQEPPDPQPIDMDVPEVTVCYRMHLQRLDALLYDTYGKWLIAQLFEMIVDFPDSEPILKDLQCCLDKVSLKTYLVEAVKESFRARLLHPGTIRDPPGSGAIKGVKTWDILAAYIQSIKIFRILDPSGVILEKVSGPIRAYLRTREDTVRCIVAYITEGDMDSELERETALVLEDTEPDDGGNEEDWNNWVPDPTDSDAANSRFSKKIDIMSILVGIYGSKELFVKEYTQLLAERLLKNYSYELEKEIRYLHLLNLRFGASELQQCDVMIKDVEASQRVDAFISSREDFQTKDTVPINALIVSSHFWPPIKEDKLKLPQVVEDALAKYQSGFETFKPNRTLEWRPSVGKVNLELEIDGNTINYTITPVLACIILLFERKEQWTLKELSTELGVSEGVIRRRLSFWQSQGLIYETALGEDPVFCLTGRLPPERSLSGTCVFSGEDETDEMVMSDDQKTQDEIEVYWRYLSNLLNLLSNKNGLPLQRIHGLLNMVSSAPHTEHNVQTFLESKVKGGELVFADSLYKLPPKTS